MRKIHEILNGRLTTINLYSGQGKQCPKCKSHNTTVIMAYDDDADTALYLCDNCYLTFED